MLSSLFDSHEFGLVLNPIREGLVDCVVILVGSPHNPPRRVILAIILAIIMNFLSVLARPCPQSLKVCLNPPNLHPGYQDPFPSKPLTERFLYI